MAKIPTPKTQFEIATGKEKPFMRGNVVSRKTDKVKDFTITLRDIDFAIKYYFKNVIKPSVVENGIIIDVPVIYGSPERWKSIKRDGYFKDEKDKLILPLIVFKRNSISKDDNYPIDKLDANSPKLVYPFKKKWSEKNRYDNFSVSVGLKPTEEYYSIVVPDYIILSYDFIIMTEAVDQMNKIVEAIVYSEGSYWGEKERFKFRTKIQTYTTNIEGGNDTQRTVKTTFSLELNGYLVPDTINKQLPLVAGNFEKAFSPKQVLFGIDTDTQLIAPSTTSTELTPSVTSIQGGTVQTVSNDAIDYLSVVITKVAASIDGSVATFTGVNIKQAPAGSGLETTKENFYFFINGQYVSSLNIASIVNSGSTVLVTFSDVGYSLDSGDIIVGVGKFLVL